MALKHVALLSVIAAMCSSCWMSPQRVNNECEWTGDTARPLSTDHRTERSHLAVDAAAAEELAIRFADTHRGFRSPGQYAGEIEYARAQNECMTRLFHVIGTRHGVTADEVRKLLRYRPVAYDVGVVFVPVAVLVCLLSDEFLRRIYQRFSIEERMPRIAGTVVASLMITALGFQIGSLWSFLAEERIRLRTNHLSYRAFYVPWSRHPFISAAAVMTLFWVVAAIRYWSGSSRAALKAASDRSEATSAISTQDRLTRRDSGHD